MYDNKRDELIQRLSKVIKEIDYRTIKNKIGILLRERNLSSQDIILCSEVIMGNALVDQLVEKDDIKLLFFFADALTKALSNSDINIKLEDYFLKVEIEELSDYKYPKEEKSIYPIIIEGVNQINDHHWQGVISGKYKHELNSAKAIIYNPNTQRDPKYSKKGLRMNIDSKKIRTIADLIKEGKYEPDNIKLNILRTGDEKFNYNPKTRTLIIYEGIINIVDGQHRKEANSLAFNEDPNLEITWPVDILNISEIRAHEYMVQINEQTKMSEEWIGTKDPSKNENNILNDMKDQQCSLFKILGEADKQIANNQALVKKSNITLAIKEIYGNEINDNDDRRQIARWLTEFFDRLIKLYSESFLENPYVVKKTSFINWKNMFYAYVALSKELQDKDNWRDLLEEKMQSIDFNDTNPMWQNMGIRKTTDANSTLRNNLYKIFRKEGVE